ncbi:unnamed protein product [Kuraishia capsulata CBS 1993]|uniref:amidase n=1 Tax=Kuraishia capsulata CBS 1993 TaxID=1382522 RepID=W6MXB3_9ASCO|nr:uncharacterized protein KUCA_T00004574001 [Kuraishia capsulata CBS 1993]CDK28590.1 unnamed protein product [Kuraishia capsulata CBS 1993]
MSEAPADPVLFESWKPKIAKYNQELENSMKQEYRLPKDKFPAADEIDMVPIAKSSGLLTESELTITETSAVELCAKMAKGELTATAVLDAFVKRATIAHELLNVATGFILEDGYARAKELDEYYAKTGKTVGPLHGLPVSIKEHIGFKDKVCHAGFVSLIENVTPDDAVTLKVLYKQGAVFYVRTNEPQSLMHPNTTNYITGKTVNANNIKLSSGGSSGGEGSLVAFKGSPMGMGTDIGGSIRFPAAFNGVYGFKPSSKIISMMGCVAAGEGQESIPCAMGPICSYLDDMTLFMKAYAEAEPWKLDPSLIPRKWEDVTLDPSKLKVAIMWDDGEVKPHPPIQRGLKFAAEKLKAAGVELVDWKPVMPGKAFETVGPMYYGDGCKACKDLLAISGEPIHPLTAYAFSMNHLGDYSAAKLWDLNATKDKIYLETFDQMNELGVDYILAPTYVGVAAEQENIHYWNYTSLWNLLDQPCVIIPTGLRQDPAIDLVEDREPWSKWDAEQKQKYDKDPALFTNGPIALQVVGRRLHDEHALAAAKIIDDILHG